MNDVVEFFTSSVLTGPMVVAIGVALLAGVASFVSPCVLPLVPGYVGYLGGMAGGGGRGAARNARPDTRRVLWGTVLFVLGFTAVFVLLGIVFAAAGAAFARYADIVMRVLGVLVIVLGSLRAAIMPVITPSASMSRSPSA